MKLTRSKKIILSSLGALVLATSIITPILVINNDEKDNQSQEKTKPNIDKLKVNLPSTATLKNLKISDGQGGKFFQDQFKNLWAMGYGTKFQVLKANSQENGYLNTGWNSDNLGLTKNLNVVTNGQFARIFEDSFGNLWAMGNGSKLQVLKANPQKNGYVKEGWTSDTNSSLTKNSNIVNGAYGTIFQDSFGNLWSMGAVQKSKKLTKSNDPASIIAAFRMAKTQKTKKKLAKLQVLKVNSQKNGYVSAGWINDNSSSGDPLLKNSNITKGSKGTIFQDSFGNLWAAGKNQKLQVLKVNPQKNGYVNEGWTSGNLGLTKNSNITNGTLATIFQDSFGNLWAMGGNRKKLQVLKVNRQKNGYVNEGWTSDNSQSGDPLLKNSKITNGLNGKIFQDSFGNLWMIGFFSKLQVLKVNPQKNGYVEDGWTSDNSGLTKNSNITISGQNGTIFQDSFGNLWTMGYGSKLQVLKVNPQKDGYVNEGWINENNKDTGDNLLKNSNITDGSNGTIFQDSFKNLWSMGKRTKPQVLKANKNKDGYVYVGTWQNT